jgi:hypothetical protein
MGYVKLKKAAGDFDIMPDANVATVKLDTSGAKQGKIRANYISDLANEYTIIPAGWDVSDAATHFVQADVTKINEALLNAKVIAGNPVPELSKVVGEVTYAADA